MKSLSMSQRDGKMLVPAAGFPLFCPSGSSCWWITRTPSPSLTTIPETWAKRLPALLKFLTFNFTHTHGHIDTWTHEHTDGRTLVWGNVNACGSQRSQIPWSWSYRRLWADCCGYWELNLGPLQEQHVYSVAESSLQPNLLFVVAISKVP